MNRYERFLALTKRLVDKATPDGNNVVWYKENAAIPDPVRPWERIEQEPTAYPCRIVFIESKDRESEYNLASYFDDKELATIGSFGISYPQGFVPEVGDGLLRDNEFDEDGHRHIVSAIRTINPESKHVAYFIGFE